MLNKNKTYSKTFKFIEKQKYIFVLILLCIYLLGINQHCTNTKEEIKKNKYQKKTNMLRSENAHAQSTQTDKFVVDLQKETIGKKADCEMKYWISRLEKEGYDKMVQKRANEYRRMSTTKFNLSESFYNDKRVADIGPGPRGSLEWADMTKLRVGIDPISNQYMSLGVIKQKMSYVTASASNIPFPDGYFDVVQSFNALDHVADIDSSIKEIQRVIKPDGLFLLIVDVNHKPTPCEPITLGWDIIDKFTELKLLKINKYEKYAPQSTYYKKLMAEGRAPEVHHSSQPYDFKNPTKRYGVIFAKFQK